MVLISVMPLCSFQPIKMHLCSVFVNESESYSALLRNVEVSLKGGNMERKAATKSVLTVSGCLPAPLTTQQVDEWRSCLASRLGPRSLSGLSCLQ